MNTPEMIEVLTAHLDGKAIEYKEVKSVVWKDASSQPCWNWAEYNYRVKKEVVSLYLVEFKGGQSAFVSEADLKVMRDGKTMNDRITMVTKYVPES